MTNIVGFQVIHCRDIDLLEQQISTLLEKNNHL